MASFTWLFTLCHLYTWTMCADEVSLRQGKEHQRLAESPLISTFIFSNNELIKLFIFTVSAAWNNHPNGQCTQESFSGGSQSCMAALHPPLQVAGDGSWAEHLPQRQGSDWGGIRAATTLLVWARVSLWDQVCHYAASWWEHSSSWLTGLNTGRKCRGFEGLGSAVTDMFSLPTR